MNVNAFKALGIFVLGIVTFGISNLVFIYLLSSDVGLDHKGRVIFPMRETVLNLITLGIYGFFWAYRIGCTTDIKESINAPSKQTVLTVILAAPFLRSMCVAYLYYRMLPERDY